ncbi:hypothetical protein SAMN03159475_2016 [Pseudomonas sp. NFPP33]|nr:hypothetical protein [Pseudomonas sp. NFPP33]SDA57961.1 hypothetical protein SAMN03159475_2016 [Pseudomonas sp. NFPP33]
MAAQTLRPGYLAIYTNLASLDPSSLHHEAHGIPLPHPADILAENLKKLRSSYKAVFDKKDISTPNFIEPLDHVKSFIYSIDEFYDSLPLIVKCFTPSGEQENHDIGKWLKQIKSPLYLSLLDSISLPHSDFRKMANKLKHAHAEVALARVSNHKGRDLQGFYIRVSTGKDDQRGPAPDIHKTYKKSVSTAFSYNHILLRSAGHIFSTLHHLNRIIFNGARPKSSVRHEDLYEILNMASEVEEVFFPDEYLRPYAKVERHKESIKIEYPFRYRKRPNENFDNIQSANSSLPFNPRTSMSHAIVPYLPLLYPETQK